LPFQPVLFFLYNEVGADANDEYDKEQTSEDKPVGLIPGGCDGEVQDGCRRCPFSVFGVAGTQDGVAARWKCGEGERTVIGFCGSMV